MVDESEEVTAGASDSGQTNELLGLFDAPAFARRGLDLEYALARVHGRCQRERALRLSMVRTRLKRWADSSTGPDDWSNCMQQSLAPLYELAGIAPAWSARAATAHHRRSAARDLTASVARFNRLWCVFIETLNLEPFNRAIDDYNRYYLIEKECVLGSSRLAGRFFMPRPRITTESLLDDYPLLPEITLMT